MSSSDSVFTGSIPSVYDRYLGPTLFEPYAIDLARRVAELAPRNVLETAAGTGILTAELARNLKSTVQITATDLNQRMLERGSSKVTGQNVTWKLADALALPFDDSIFDAVTCQFGVMFFPDRVAGFREARRVLAPGGTFVFSVWDQLESNEYALLIHEAVAACFPHDPPEFLMRTPYGYHAADVIAADLREAGFNQLDIETVALTSEAGSYRDLAVGLCLGSSLKREIQSRDGLSVEEATERAAEALANRFGKQGITVQLRAHVVTSWIGDNASIS